MPATFPHAEIEDFGETLEIIFARISPPTVSTAPPYKALSNGLTGSCMKSSLFTTESAPIVLRNMSSLFFPVKACTS